jgi:PBP1b-binding outer membrane lipoprotein LpoB
MLALAALLASALCVAGCSSQIADMSSVGPPASAPARPAEPAGYLPVNQLPPDRDDTEMDPATRAKLEADLIAARDRQAAASAASTTTPVPPIAASK